MPIDIEDQLGQYFDWLEQQIGASMRPPTADNGGTPATMAPGVIEISATRSHPRWRRRLLATSAAAILAVGTIAALQRRHSDHNPTVPGDSPPPHTPPTSKAPSDPPAGLLAPGARELLPPAPLQARVSPAAVWTGSEMIVWGGSEFGGQSFGDGARYDPTTRTWTMLPDAPIAPRADTATAWTGTEMLIWGGGDNGTSFTDGAAFNPTANTWRTLPAFDLGHTIRPTSSWTGSEMIVIGGLNGTPKGAAFNPTTNTWRTIAAPPGRSLAPYPNAVWTGTEIVATLALAPRDTPIVAAYQPASDMWTVLTDDIPSTSVPSLVWTGSVVLALNLNDDTIRQWDPTSGQWVTIDAPAPDDTGRIARPPVWTGETVVFSNGSPTVDQFDPRTGLWRIVVVEQPIVQRLDPVTLWGDGILLTWGGLITNPDGTYVAAADGTAWRPPIATDVSVVASTLPGEQIPVNTEQRANGTPQTVAGEMVPDVGLVIDGEPVTVFPPHAPSATAPIISPNDGGRTGGVDYMLVPITELNSPTERTPHDDYLAAIHDGPIVGPDGHTFGDETWQDGAPVVLPDYVGVLDPDGGTTVIGFLSQQERWAPPGTDRLAGRNVYGIDATVIGQLVDDIHPADAAHATEYTTTRFIPDEG